MIMEEETCHEEPHEKEELVEEGAHHHSSSLLDVVTSEDNFNSDEDSAWARAKQITLAKWVKADLGEWLQANSFLYDRDHTDYKNWQKKQRILEPKAKTLNPPLSGEELGRWIHTKRTRYGRLTKRLQKSGSGRHQLTALDKWILSLFQFIEPHIMRQKETKSLGIREVCKIFSIFICRSFNISNVFPIRHSV